MYFLNDHIYRCLLLNFLLFGGKLRAISLLMYEFEGTGKT